MKTNPFFLFTTALLVSGASLVADDNLCGGADDDQFFGAPSICGGADDDQFSPPVLQGLLGGPLSVVTAPGQPPLPQGIVSDPLGYHTPVLQGMTTDPLGIPPPPPGANANQVMTFWNQLIAPLPTAICGGNGNDSFHPLPLTDAMILNLLGTGSLTGDTMDDDDLWGGGGTDEIVGGDGADFLKGFAPLMSWMDISGPAMWTDMEGTTLQSAPK